MKRIGVFAGFALVLSVMSANAATLECTASFGNKNDPKTTDYSLSNAVAAVCVDKDNDDVTQIGLAYPGGAWTLSDKNDEVEDPAGAIFFTDAPVNNTQGGGTDGNWTINSFPALTQIVLVLKAGNTFAAFLLDPFATEGTWSTSRGLSHASLYYRSCKEGDAGCGVPSTVPLPAGGVLLAGGLAALAILRRRSKMVRAG